MYVIKIKVFKYISIKIVNKKLRLEFIELFSYMVLYSSFEVYFLKSKNKIEAFGIHRLLCFHLGIKLYLNSKIYFIALKIMFKIYF